jgi:hypothetical protein
MHAAQSSQFTPRKGAIWFIWPVIEEMYAHTSKRDDTTSQTFVPCQSDKDYIESITEEHFRSKYSAMTTDKTVNLGYKRYKTITTLTPTDIANIIAR